MCTPWLTAKRPYTSEWQPLVMTTAEVVWDPDSPVDGRTDGSAGPALTHQRPIPSEQSTHTPSTRRPPHAQSGYHRAESTRHRLLLYDLPVAGPNAIVVVREPGGELKDLLDQPGRPLHPRPIRPELPRL